MRLDISEAQRHYPEKPPLRADHTLLQDPEKKKEWLEAIRKRHALLTGASVDGVTATKLQVLEAAMQAAAKGVLMVDGRRRPDWFLAAKRSLEPVIADHNRLMAACMANPSSAEAKDAARGARKAVRRAVEAVRSSWVNSVLAVVNADGTVNSADGNPISPQAAWHAIRALRRGPRLVEEVKPLKLRKVQNGANPALCESTEENKKFMVEYFKTVFSKVCEFDPAAVEEVPQRRVQPHLDMTLSVHEIRRAVVAMENGKSGGDAKLPAEYWKALMGNSVATRIPGRRDGCVL